ncbi:MAG: hypothetical protein EXQ56_06925 [Acidobacteria bacterium]|nr:hypothetical protein [Acidobacteriota bacterium]
MPDTKAVDRLERDGAGESEHQGRELLTRGATMEEVARVLGNTAKVVADHYAPWCLALQNRVRDLMTQVHVMEATESRLQGGYKSKSKLGTNWKQ